MDSTDVVVKTQWIVSDDFLRTSSSSSSSSSLPSESSSLKSANITRFGRLSGSYYVVLYNFPDYIELKLILDSIYSPPTNDENSTKRRSRRIEARVKTKYRFALLDERDDTVNYVFGEWRIKCLSTSAAECFSSSGFRAVARKTEITRFLRNHRQREQQQQPFRSIQSTRTEISSSSSLSSTKTTSSSTGTRSGSSSSDERRIRFQIEICELPLYGSSTRHDYYIFYDEHINLRMTALNFATTNLKLIRVSESDVKLYVTDYDYRIHALSAHSFLLEKHSKVFAAFFSYYSSTQYFSTERKATTVASSRFIGEHSAYSECSNEGGIRYKFALRDFSYKTYLCLLSYLYVGYLPSFPILDIIVLAELLLLADKYDFRELRLLCQDTVISSSKYIRNKLDAEIFYHIAESCNMIFFKDCITDIISRIKAN